MRPLQASMQAACSPQTHQRHGRPGTPACPSFPFSRTAHPSQLPRNFLLQNRRQYNAFICQNSSLNSNISSSPSIPPPRPPTGIFLRDLSRSDMTSYERSLMLLELGKLQRLTAMQLIEGIELKHGGEWLSVEFLTVVPFFKVTEKYRLGNTVSIPRRDLRPGNQQAEAYIDPADGALQLKSTWKEPNAGSLNEKLLLSSDGNTLEYTSTLTVPQGKEVTKQVYTRVKEWKPKYSWNPLKAMQMLAMSKED